MSPVRITDKGLAALNGRELDPLNKLILRVARDNPDMPRADLIKLVGDEIRRNPDLQLLAMQGPSDR